MTELVGDGWAFGILATLTERGVRGSLTGVPPRQATTAAAISEFAAHRTLAEISRIELPADDDLLRWAQRYAAATARRTS